MLGGTTHTDPMPNYPLADLMALVNGADDMPSAQEIARAVLDETRTRQGGPTGGTNLGSMMTWSDAKFAEVNAHIAARWPPTS